MNCPKCNRPMRNGRLLGDRYKIKWMNAEDSLFLGIFAFGSIALGKGVWSCLRPRVHGFRCAKCGIIVMDENNCDE